MNRQENSGGKNASLAAGLIALVIGMLLLSYAAVPLYRLFCVATGFGGTVMQAENEALFRMMEKRGTRPITVEFNTEIEPDLPWEFRPVEHSVRVVPGERRLVFFKVTNHGDTPLIGTSVFNVTPHKTGGYFVKTHCFCYREQRVLAGETVTLPVSFFLDPALEKNPEMDDIRRITLSYTFFRVKIPSGNN